MNIFALDASSRITSLAFQSITQHEAPFSKEYQFESSYNKISHSEEIAVRFNALISKVGIDAKELDLLILGSGPGSYTGLRISYAFVKGIACSLKVPVIEISPFAASAFYEIRKDEKIEKIMVTSDARKNELYVSSFTEIKDISKDPPIELIKISDFMENRDKNIQHISFSPELFHNQSAITSVASKLIYFYSHKMCKNEEFSLDFISKIKPKYIRGLQAKTIAERRLEKL